MTYRLFLVFCGAVAAISMAGCHTPGTRARTHAGAFSKLSTADRKTVLAGKVHPGMSEEAVYIAWGEPDRKQTATDGKGSTETWLYQRQLTLTPAMDSFDRWLPGNAVFRASVPLTLRAGFGFGGIGNEGAFQTQPHLLITDDTVRRAEFTAGRLSDYDLRPAAAASAR